MMKPLPGKGAPSDIRLDCWRRLDEVVVYFTKCDPAHADYLMITFFILFEKVDELEALIKNSESFMERHKAGEFIEPEETQETIS